MTDYIRWQKSSLEEALASLRVVMLTGARQCGKTTLAKTLVDDSVSYRTLDDRTMRQAAENDPHLFVEHVADGGALIIDEVQKVPDLLPAIKQVVDRDNRPGQFLITGSAQRNRPAIVSCIFCAAFLGESASLIGRPTTI